MNFLKGVEDEKTASVLCGSDAVLVFEASVIKFLEILLLPRFGISRDRWVVLFEWGVVLVKGYRQPGLILVGRVRKDEAGLFQLSSRQGESRDMFVGGPCGLFGGRCTWVGQQLG